MKTLLVILCAIILTAGWAPGGLTLTTGQTWTYEFTTLPFSHVETLDQIPANYYPATSAGFVMVTKSGLTIGEEASYRLFEDNVDESSAPTIQLGLDPTSTTGVSGYWQDLQGIMQISMITGSMSLDTLHFRIHIPIDVDTYNVYENTILIPEPSVISIAVCSAMGFWLMRRRPTPCRGIAPDGSGIEVVTT